MIFSLLRFKWEKPNLFVLDRKNGIQKVPVAETYSIQDVPFQYSGCPNSNGCGPGNSKRARQLRVMSKISISIDKSCPYSNKHICPSEKDSIV